MRVYKIKAPQAAFQAVEAEEVTIQELSDFLRMALLPNTLAVFCFIL